MIKSLQLIGATKWFIKGPFIIEGIVHGLIAAVLAVYSLVGIIRFSKYLIYDLTEFGIIFDQVFIFQVLLSISILVGFGLSCDSPIIWFSSLGIVIQTTTAAKIVNASNFCFFNRIP